MVVLRTGAVLVLAGGLACGPAAPELHPSLAGLTSATSPTVEGQLELDRDGRLPTAVVAPILASEDPRDARAKRILAVMDEGEPPEANEDSRPDGAWAALAPPPLPVEGHPQTHPQTQAQTQTQARDQQAHRTPATSTVRVSKAAPDSATLTGMGLRRSRTGATLSLSATGGVLVGVANQRQRGIVRLVVDATAAPSALRSRPRVTGAHVTSVRQVGRSTFVTLALDAGWRLGPIHKTRRGAHVRLERV